MCRTREAARFTSCASRRPEFTSLCPVTGQPDFAHLVIDYAPGRDDRREQEPQAVPRQLPQPLRLPRGRDRRDRPAADRRDEAAGGCASAAIGIRVAECRSTSSGNPARRRKACGCPTRECSLTADGGRRMAGAPKVAVLGAGLGRLFHRGRMAAAGVPVTFIGRPKTVQGHRPARPDAERLSRLAAAAWAWRSRLSLRSRGARGRRDHRRRGEERRYGRGGRRHRDAGARRRDGHQLPERHQQRRGARAGSWRAVRGRPRDGSVTTSPILATAASTKAWPATSVTEQRAATRTLAERSAEGPRR